MTGKLPLFYYTTSEIKILQLMCHISYTPDYLFLLLLQEGVIRTFPI